MLLQMAGFPSILWLYNILLYTHTCIYHLLYLFVNGHLGCFHTLAIMNNASVNMVIQLSL